MASPFDLMKKCHKKDGYPTQDDMKGYSQWLMNKQLSCDQQLVMLANELNVANITDQMNFDCLYYGMPKLPNKYIPWLAGKPKKETELLYIMEFYGVNQNVGKQYQQLISDEEKKEIIEFFEKRGIKK